MKAKISGSWQLIAVAFDLYPRPIPTPVHSLRPSNGTCEQCHWPTKFVGERLKVRTHFLDDEANTEVKTALMVKVGGSAGGASHGIHWHVDPNHIIRYLSDEKRQTIYDIELTDKKAGTTKVFKGPEAAPAGSEWRTMDCVDCHNRPAHNFRSPENEVDLAMVEGRIDRTLPFIRREGVRILTEKEYASHDEARAGIAAAVREFYVKNYPDRAGSAEVEQAGKTLGDAYCWNNFPHMRVVWNTYPSHLGHQQSPGCFRCHDNKHKSEDGEKVSKKCGTCHNVVVEEESDSKLLQELGLQEAPPAAEEAAPATTDGATASARRRRPARRPDHGSPTKKAPACAGAFSVRRPGLITRRGGDDPSWPAPRSPSGRGRPSGDRSGSGWRGRRPHSTSRRSRSRAAARCHDP